MSGISLTSSMRNNLLSLQQTAKLQDMTQNRLATGLKVNSAIDNPSSYYTAQSLNNRAEDLNILLDAMSQGIQTLKAVNESIEAGTKFLEQAKSVANQAFEASAAELISLPPVVAEVSTEAELLAAIDSGKKGTILLKNDIALSEDTKLVLKDGQSLSGKDGDTGKPTLSFKFTNVNGHAIELGNGSIISDLSLELNSDNAGSFVVSATNGKTATAQNLKIKYSCEKEKGLLSNSLLRSDTGGSLILRGNFEGTGEGNPRFISASGADTSAVIKTGAVINFQATGRYIRGIEFYDKSQLTVEKAVTMNFDLASSTSSRILGIYMNGASADIDSANINIRTSGIGSSIGMEVNQNGRLSVRGSSKINIETNSDGSTGLWSDLGASMDFSGDTLVNINNKGADSYGIRVSGDGSSFNVLSSRNRFNIISSVMVNHVLTAGQTNLLTMEKGSQISWAMPDKTEQGYWQASSTVRLAQSDSNADLNGFETVVSVQKLSDTAASLADLPVNLSEIKSEKEEGFSLSFNEILAQYDNLINDSWYKGVNLLKSQDLKVVFNESRTSDLDIKGVDATTAGLGLETADWSSAAGVQESLDQIDSAINQLRLYASEFGNYYQIVTTRENFTNSLINVLTEGADQLTLADMNQESANMLALQTRQQLAVNSLSLASQASQSVLKLF